MSNLKKRTFFLKSAHLDDIRLFSTRWVLSYLKGPLKRDEIASLMKEQKVLQNTEIESITEPREKNEKFESIQNIDVSIPQYYEPDPTLEHNYLATLMAKTKVHFYNQSKGIDEAHTLWLSLDLPSTLQNIRWEEARELDIDFENFPHTKPSKAKFQALPSLVLNDKGLKKASKELKENLYRNQSLELQRCISPKLESKVGESSSDFIVRLQDLLSDKKETEIEKLQVRYAKKEKVFTTRLSRANERVEKESSDSTSSMIEAGIAVIGALFGRSTPTKIGRAFKKSSNILKERGDMSRAEERVAQIHEDIEALEYELEDKIDVLNEKYNAENCEIEDFTIKPRRTDIEVEACAIVWRIV
ncbi:MAG TPA: hypothetical protein EYP16_01630 [Candidatus Atribacteria bacterium]|nr:hypothetical protein [Candidatus Atribacteria bacterium]